MTQLEIEQVAPDRYRVRGELDMASAPSLEEALRPLEGAPLTLDVAELTFIDSSGLHALVKLAGRMNGSAPLVLDNVTAGVQRLLDIVGLESLPGIAVNHDA